MEKTDWTAFEAVWDRVTGPSESVSVPKNRPAPSPSRSEESRLAMFLQETAAAETAYRALQARTSLRWLRELCARLRQQEAMHRRQLQSACFLLTGDTCPLASLPDPGDPATELLRKQLLRERSSAAAYRKAARDADSMELSRLYGELAAGEARHEEMLRAALMRLMA